MAAAATALIISPDNVATLAAPPPAHDRCSRHPCAHTRAHAHTGPTHRWMGQYGITNESTPTFRCECPPCFRSTPSGGCEPACDLSHCLGSDGCGATHSRGGGGAWLHCVLCARVHRCGHPLPAAAMCPLLP
jgi:hypothetical protein